MDRSGAGPAAGADRVRHAVRGDAAGGDAADVRRAHRLSGGVARRRVRCGAVLGGLREGGDVPAADRCAGGSGDGGADHRRRVVHDRAVVRRWAGGPAPVGRGGYDLPAPRRAAGGRGGVCAGERHRRAGPRRQDVLLSEGYGAVPSGHGDGGDGAGDAGSGPAVHLHREHPPHGEPAAAVVPAVAVEREERVGAGGSGQRQVPDGAGDIGAVMVPGDGPVPDGAG